MAYVTKNLSELFTPIGGAGQRWWSYWTADTIATVIGAGYVSDAGNKRMQVGDIVWVFSGTLNTTGADQVPSTHARGTVSEFASQPTFAVLQVSSITTGAATLVPANIDAGSIVVNSGTSTSAAGAVTLNSQAGVITTEALTTISQGVYTLTISNSLVAATDIVFASVQNGTNTTGIPVVTSVAAAAGTITVKIANATTTTTPFGGTLKISFMDFKAS